MADKDDRKKKTRKEQRKEKRAQIADFAVVLELPERLAILLRLIFHLSKTEWDFALDKIRQKKAYREWQKSKGPGKGFRKFCAPCAELKLVQRRILDNFLAQIPTHFIRHGCNPGSSILTNAKHHAGFAKAVFTIDLVNAFPSVFRSRVRGCLEPRLNFFLKQYGSTIGEKMSREDKAKMLESVVDLLVFHDQLPQGPPTSPRILAIVCYSMDLALMEVASKNSTPFQSYRLTAYADNYTLSSNGEIPEEIQKELFEAIQKHGFHPHTRPDKCEYFSPATGKSPVITGLVTPYDAVDEKVTIAPNKVNQLRARLHQLLKKSEWSDEDRALAAGTIGFIREICRVKLPSKLRKYVEQTEARLKPRQLALPFPDIGPEPPEKKRPLKKGAKKTSGTAHEKTVSDCGESIPF